MMKMSEPVELDDSNFDENTKKEGVFVVDFWAPWCGPCRMVSPIIDELAKDLAGKVGFGKLNVDENQQTAAKYQVMSIPTLLVFKDGELADQIVGALPRPMLEEKITKHI